VGCWTIYVVREHDGSVWATGSKWGRTEFASAAELDAYLANQSERWVPSDVGPSWCRGWFVDRGAQIARTYHCDCAGSNAFELDRSLRAAPGWQDWDLGVAWERSTELAARAGVAPADPAPALDAWIGFVEAGCLTRYPTPDRFPHRWDPATNTLAYEYFVEMPTTALTTIDAKNRVHDYAFDDDVLLAALGRGTLLLDELKTVAPVPMIVRPACGAVIDSALRAIWLWTVDDIAPATYAELGRRWPGWRVERELAGRDGYLERIGRAGWEDPEVPPVLRYALPPRSFEYIVERSGEVIPPEPVSDEETRLLAAIHADLASSDARLVYADYLLARGDQRGKLIAVQCEIARLEKQVPRPARLYSLVELALELRRLYGREEASGGSELRHERGFIAHAAVDSVEKVAGVLAEVPTIESLRVMTLAANAVPQLAGRPELARLRALTTRPEFGALRALAEIESLAGLELLQIDTDDRAIARELGAVLAGPHPFGRIAELRLCGLGFDGAAVRAVLDGRLDRLETLYCGGLKSLDEQAMRDLARCGSLERLRRIVIWGGPSGPLTALLAKSPHLAQLREWTTDTHPDLVELLDNLPGLRALTLRFHAASETFVPQLAAASQLARLETLSLTHLGAAVVATLADSPFIDGIGVLHLAQLFGDTRAAVDRLRDRLGDRLVITTW
jgi:uncharacterized protein (TIGR02996 family)